MPTTPRGKQLAGKKDYCWQDVVWPLFPESHGPHHPSHHCWGTHPATPTRCQIGRRHSESIQCRSAAWNEAAELEVADKADWYTVCRRISLALVGTGMSLEEIRALEQIEESDRIRWWTEYLLRDRRSADYLAERLTRATVGTNQGPFLIFRRRKYAKWLADELFENAPYDVLVRKLITANGSWTDAPQVNFFTATINDNSNNKPDLVQITGRTSRAFLAQRIDCLQCHRDYLGNVNFLASSDMANPSTVDPTTSATNAPDQTTVNLREGEQEDFHRLAAFFSGIAMENPFVGLRTKPEDYKVRLLDADEETVMERAVPYMPELLPSDGAPRQRLAHWLTHPKNRAFARATVNRVWAMLFGRAWIQPVDSIPLDGPFPIGFELLVDDFIEHRFDLRRLIRVIVFSEAFQRDSRLKVSEPTEKHEELLGSVSTNAVAARTSSRSDPSSVPSQSNQRIQLDHFTAGTIRWNQRLYTGLR